MFKYPWGDFHSLNLGWFLLQFKDWVEKIQEYLDNGGGTSENLANVIAPVFNAANTYSAGDYVLYNNELYKANQSVNPGTWNPDAWDRCLIVDEMGSGGGSGVDYVARLMIAGQYSSTFAYQKYAICRYNDKLWMANTDLPTEGEEWNSAHWDEITVGAGLTGLRQSVETLSNSLSSLNAGQIGYNNQATYTPGTVGSNMQGIYRELNAVLQATNNKHYKVVCGAIRNSGNGWELIDDTGHNPVNITGVTVTEVGGIPVLQIAHNVGASRILSLIVGCDETFAGLYDIGASVGLDLSNLTIYRKAHQIGGMVQVNNNAVDIQYSDFTAGSFYPDGGIRLDYSETLVADEVYKISLSGQGCIPQAQSLGTSYAIVRGLNPVDGTSWNSTQYPNNTRLYIAFNVAEKVVDPSTIVNANGNFWILGLLEVA